MIDNDESVSDGKWTDEENLILLQHVMGQPEVLEKNISKQLVTKLTNAYNKSANEAVNILKLNLVRLKDEKQVKQKLQHLKQRKALALLLIEEQINLSVKILLLEREIREETCLEHAYSLVAVKPLLYFDVLFMNIGKENTRKYTLYSWVLFNNNNQPANYSLQNIPADIVFIG